MSHNWSDSAGAGRPPSTGRAERSQVVAEKSAARAAPAATRAAVHASVAATGNRPRRGAQDEVSRRQRRAAPIAAALLIQCCGYSVYRQLELAAAVVIAFCAPIEPEIRRVGIFDPDATRHSSRWYPQR